jgi:hypothetical protein
VEDEKEASEQKASEEEEEDLMHYENIKRYHK